VRGGVDAAGQPADDDHAQPRQRIRDPARVVEPVAGGFYYAPTLITGAAPGSEILTSEVFGPVLTMQTFATEDEAIALANNTDYGLAATLVCGDRPRAERIAGQLVAGTVWVNCFFVRNTFIGVSAHR
jgi:acyl-CoA reductase-like NAD-dependent aldehyde dehydrogenase